MRKDEEMQKMKKIVIAIAAAIMCLVCSSAAAGVAYAADSDNIPVVQGITRNADGDFILSWGAVDGMDHYEVLTNVSVLFDDVLYTLSKVIATTTDTEADVSFYMSKGKERTFYVRAVDAKGNEYESEYSYTYNAPILSCGVSGFEDEIDISIVDYSSTKDFDSLEIYRKKGEGEYTKIKTFKYKTSKSYSFTDVPEESGIYTYQVRYKVDEYTDTVYSDSATFIQVPVIKSLKLNMKTYIATVELEEADSIADYYYFSVRSNESYMNGSIVWYGKVENTGSTTLTLDLNTDVGLSIDKDNLLSWLCICATYGDWYNRGLDYGESAVAATQVCSLPKPLLRGSVSTTSARAGITWNTVSSGTLFQYNNSDDADCIVYPSVIIYKYNEETEKWEKLKTLGNTSDVFNDTDVEADTDYQYKIRSYFKSPDGNIFYSEYSDVITVHTLPTSESISQMNAAAAGKYGKLYQSQFDAAQDIMAAGYGVYSVNLENGMTAYYSYGTWSFASGISDFFDYKGYYSVAYETGDNIAIVRLDSDSQEVKSTITIPQKYPLVGGVTCDDSGNYYIAWGQCDTNETKNVVTFAVSKYDYNGNHIKTVTYKGDDFDVKEPFEAGNCSIAISGDTLVCYFARLMYKGTDGINHQGSKLVGININTMKNCGIDGDYYASHAFDEQVIVTDNGDFEFAVLGDAYPRGFAVSYPDDSWISKKVVPFHFYGKLGENTTNAQFGGIGDVSTGIALVGASGKSMKTLNSTKQLFLQVVSTATGESVVGSSTRTGTSGGEDTTDTNIKWLTSYTDGYVLNPRMVVDEKDRIIILWTKVMTDSNGYDTGDWMTYYMIHSASGTVLQKATPIGQVLLNGTEELKYKDGRVYWSTSKGNGVIVTNYLEVGENQVFVNENETDLLPPEGHVYVKGVCSDCGDIRDGFAYVSGKWGYYKNNTLQKETGLVYGTISTLSSSPKWYYIENGIYTKASGITKKATGSDTTWYYVKKGVYTKATGIAKKADGSSSTWYYVLNGKYTKNTGIAKKADGSSSIWYFVKKGIYTKSTGIAKKADGSSSTWYFVKKGVYTKASGLAKKADGSSSTWYYVSGGKYVSTAAGLAQKADGSSKTWYYVLKGKYTKNTGIAKKADGSSSTWYYVKNGVYTKSTVLATKADGSSSVKYYVLKGIYTSYTGSVTIDKVEYTLSKGKVTGHYENVLVSEAWTEDAVYENHVICNCGFDFTAEGYSQDEIDDHANAHLDAGEGSEYEEQQVLVTPEVYHEAVYEKQWVADSAA